VSADPAEAHFGLGTARVADELRVAWADGSETVLPAVQADGALSIAKLPDGAPSCAEGGESNGCSPGGPIDSKAECLLEWHVTPTPPPGKDGPPSGSLVCTDGDPACDADEGVDHECAFRVAVCINNRDPRLAACAPSDVASLVVRAPGSASRAPASGAIREALADLIGPRSGGLGFVTGSPFADATPDHCSPTGEVRVPLRERRNGALAPGLVKLKLVAKARDGRRDADTLRLECQPAS